MSEARTSYWENVRFEGHISSDRTKKFLVDLYATKRADAIRLDCVSGTSCFDEKVTTFYDDNKENGVTASVWLIMKKRKGESKPRLSDNPSVKKFKEEYNLFMCD